MKSFALLITLASAATAVAAQDCDCTSYPFKPNPPCYGQCVAKLSAKTLGQTSLVKGIDPGVSVGIGVLSQAKDRSAVDFKAIQGKQDLERAALKSMNAAENLKSVK